MTEFSGDVYAQIRLGTQQSAAVLTPMILQWVNNAQNGTRRPVRFLDVGCGEGWWSEALFDAGCTGDSIDQEPPLEHAPGIHIDAVDLEGDYTLPRGYDLALCLEVAEHLDELSGHELVYQLTRCASIVVWSAAIPAQGGHGHKNEQWPAYWNWHFRRAGWALLDPFRIAIWDDENVEPWYRQNLLIALPSKHEQPEPLHLVHPAVYQARCEQAEYWRELALERERLLIDLQWKPRS
jgi:hypothetical protein